MKTTPKCKLNHSTASLRLMNISFLPRSRWGDHAARFRHGPHPCSKWRLCRANETHAASEGVQDLPFGRLQILRQKGTIQKLDGKSAKFDGEGALLNHCEMQ